MGISGIDSEVWFDWGIRNTLYPALKDYQGVTEYPDVRGMYRNVYFVSHTNREAGGGEDSISKHNEYEVRFRHSFTSINYHPIVLLA